MRRYIATSSISGIVLVLCGCNALDEKGSNGSKLFVPVDERPVQQALTAPPPITGGTLAVSPDGRYAVAADPDRDRISIVELESRAVRHVALDAGDEPGRVAIDGSGRAYVALRRSGVVVGVELASGELLNRTRVCPSPRGLAHDAQSELLHVACADGRLVTLNAQVEVTRSVDLATDLRDVMVRGEELLVSTYKTAELLVVDAAGAVQRRLQPPRSKMQVRDPDGNHLTDRLMQPNLAWRAVAGADGSVMMLHQQASESMVDIEKKPEDEQASPYGGGGDGFACEGIVQSGVTQMDMSGGARSMTIIGGVLGVDMARSPRDGSVVVALPGTSDPEAPRPVLVSDLGGDSFDSAPMTFPAPGGGIAFNGGRLAHFDGGMFPAHNPPPGIEPSDMNCVFPSELPMPGQPTAVAFTPDGVLVAQSREPALLVIGDPWSMPSQGVVDLGGDSVRDTGHDLFHRDSGAGIACASCHGEGGDDGHTWVFSGIGARRTQAVNVGLEGTAPFHWDGDLHDLGALMEEVFVGRMGGVHQSDARLGALQGWLFAQKPFAPIVDAADPAAERGKHLFESGSVGCTGCHSGDKLTDSRSYDVGTGERAGERMQVPSLRGVGYRAPFIHNGCAGTLRDRFDPSCGGDKHGNTAHLNDAEVDDLIAYLQSL